MAKERIEAQPAIEADAARKQLDTNQRDNAMSIC
jgi:hypothetical protein